ncbi:hypothetical protein MTO96_013827 [Rhipicephalus appendiculatus]
MLERVVSQLVPDCVAMKRVLPELRISRGKEQEHCFSIGVKSTEVCSRATTAWGVCAINAVSSCGERQDNVRRWRQRTETSSIFKADVSVPRTAQE